MRYISEKIMSQQKDFFSSQKRHCSFQMYISFVFCESGALLWTICTSTFSACFTTFQLLRVSDIIQSYVVYVVTYVCASLPVDNAYFLVCPYKGNKGMTCGFCSVKECALFFFCQRDQSSKKDKIEKRVNLFFFYFCPFSINRS